ncbi:MAG TPA: hypothetical protein VHX60_12810 [Acidobacteriaceae bacterium]|jgi:hypothetical protein|nr:hypothetical protein [Acidobacteriaceae bacterium]
MKTVAQQLPRLICNAGTLLFALIVLATAVPTLKSQETLNNAAVVRMVQAHLGTDVIVEQIRSNPGHFLLTTNSLIQLKQLGVPDKVIAAMQAKNGGSAPQPASPGTVAETTSSDPCGAESGKWRIESKEGGLNGSVREAVLCEPFHDGRDYVGVFATCGPGLALQVVYTSPDKDLGSMLFQPDATVVMGQVFNHKMRVTVRYRIDRGEIVTVNPATDYKNEATLKFVDKDDVSETSVFDRLGAAGFYQDFYRAKDVSIELPLNDGETPVVDVRPQDPIFRKFSAACPGSGVVTDATATYSADEFAELLPGMLRKAAVAHGLDSHAWDKEIDYISSAVKTCAQITPQMAAGSGPKADPLIWHTYGQEYQICQGLDSYRHMYLRRGGGEDVSMASGRVQGSPYMTHPYRPDVGLRIYQPGLARPMGEEWRWDGEKGFRLSVNVLADSEGDSAQFDTVLEDVAIERSAHGPQAGTAETAVTPGGTPALPAPPQSPTKSRQAPASGPPLTTPTVTAPSKADAYFLRGQALLRQATLNTGTGKLILPPGCAEAFQKYLALAPNGQYAGQAKSILKSAGVPVQSN